jgi:uncharacterized MAPEG superfamily protein
VENLVVFAPLAIAVHVANLSTAATATAAMVYFYARLVHFIVFTAGIPGVRTLSFLVGCGCQVVLAIALLSH